MKSISSLEQLPTLNPSQFGCFSIFHFSEVFFSDDILSAKNMVLSVFMKELLPVGPFVGCYITNTKNVKPISQKNKKKKTRENGKECTIYPIKGQRRVDENVANKIETGTLYFFLQCD